MAIKLMLAIGIPLFHSISIIDSVLFPNSKASAL